MEALLDLIFSNMLIVIAIVGGLISWFRGMQGDEKEKRQPQKRPMQQKSEPSPSPTPSGPARRPEPVRSERQPKEDKSGKKMEDYYREKVEEATQTLSTGVNKHTKGAIGDDSITGYTIGYETPNQDIHNAIPDYRHKSKARSKKKPAPSLSVTRNLNRKKLSESIMMAEILGPPRAHKPHQMFDRNK
ncbi:hypothetical protein [Thalassobacillus hwangdonensis]|uniref:Uncharacterized protein n=1 Tax=Thalassobacillus hwangdonensis TaxID=546108 RepID=A0ABW3KYU7_9BACI